jgi:uncharacterized protein
MDLQSLVNQIDDLSSEPPFDKWDPPFCGDIDMQIKKDGRWFYMGSPIGRIKLVKLFASVLMLDPETNEYFLKTPAEKVRIQVEDVPFVITQWSMEETFDGSAIVVTTNLEQQVVLSNKHPLYIDEQASESDAPNLYVEVKRGLKARIHRNVFYQWLETDTGIVFEQGNSVYLRSGRNNFLLGSF